jgi:hypothetical protein
LSFSKYNNFKKSTLHGHPFFCKTHSYRKRETSQSDFSIGCGAQLGYQTTPKILDEELSPSVVQSCPELFIVIHKPQNGLGGI